MNRIALANAIAMTIGVGNGPTQFENKIVGQHEMQPGMIALANDSLISSSLVQTELTEYAIGWARTNKLRELRNHLAPTRVRASRQVRVTSYVNADAFQSIAPAKRKRAIGADHADVSQPMLTKSVKTLDNVGLQICIDQDQLKEQPNLERIWTQWLIDILMRADTQEAISAIDAGAVSVSKTWSASTNPDYDVRFENKAGSDLSGIYANSAVFGDAAILVRMAAYEAAARANGAAASAALNGDFAARIGVDRLLINAERYSSSASARTEFIGQNVYLFTAIDSEPAVDPSNVVRLVNNASYGGGEYAVYSWDPSPKKRIIMVEAYSTFHTQHVLGIRKLPVS